MLTDKTGIIISNTQNVCSNFKSYSSWHFLFPNYVACTRSQFTCSHAPCVCLSGGNPRILSTKDIMLDSLRHFQKTCNLLETKISVNKFEKMTNFKANHLYFSNIKNMNLKLRVDLMCHLIVVRPIPPPQEKLYIALQSRKRGRTKIGHACQLSYLILRKNIV